MYLEYSDLGDTVFPSEVMDVNNTLYTKWIRMNLRYHTMIWITDTRPDIRNLFHSSLNSKCVIMNMDQPKHIYGHFSYTVMPPESTDESKEYPAIHGIWDHSWIDALQASL